MRIPTQISPPPESSIRLFSRSGLNEYLGECVNEGGIASSEGIWLVTCDFDRFKDVNNIYGRTIVDAMLEYARFIAAAEVKRFQSLHNLQGIGLSFVGDEISLVIPSNRLRREQLMALLNSIRDGIDDGIRDRFMVVAVDNFEPLAAGLTYGEQERLSDLLKQQLMVMDFVPYTRGYRILAPVAAAGSSGTGESVTTAIKQLIPAARSLTARVDWLFDSCSRSYVTFNRGYFWALSLSCGAVRYRHSPVRTNLEGRERRRDMHSEQTARRMCALSEKNLKLSKLLKQPVISDCEDSETGTEEKSGCILDYDYADRKKPHGMRSESDFSHQVECMHRAGSTGTCVIIEPNYSLAGHHRHLISLCSVRDGTRECMGLKGVNERCGYSDGDAVIRLLEAVFQDSLESFGRSADIHPSHIISSRFVDKCMVYIRDEHPGEKRLMELTGHMRDNFNARSHKVKIAQLIVSNLLQAGEKRTFPLMKSLEYTRLSEVCPMTLSEDGSILLKQCSDLVYEEGERMELDNAYRSALRLASREALTRAA